MKKSRMIILIILSIIQSFLLVLNMFFIKLLIDKAVLHEDITKMVFLVLATILTQIILKVSVEIIRNKYNLYLELSLKRGIYKNSLNKSYQDIRFIHSGQMSNIYLTDVLNIAHTYSYYIPTLFLFLSRFLFAFIALCILQYKVLLVLLALGIVLFALAIVYSNYMRKIHKASLASDDMLNSYMQETVENIRYIKAMSSEEGMLAQLDKKIDDNRKKKNKRNMLSLIGSQGITIASNICYGGTMCFAAYLVYSGNITYGALTALVSIVSYFESPFSGLAQIVNRLNACKASKDRIDNISNMANEDNLLDIHDFDKIEFKDMSFSYDKNIYDNFNYVINKNDIITIKGKSGTGKTTLLNLLLGLVKPNSGSINIINGDEKINVGSSTRMLFSLVPQENILFSGTIKDNIKLFHPHKSDEEIIDVLKKVKIYEEIKSLDYTLNERGSGLSLGQIQRILIAIALLKDSPIILMDEFSSALDIENEANIIALLKSLNKTIIMVTHKNINIDSRELFVDEKDN